MRKNEQLIPTCFAEAARLLAGKPTKVIGGNMVVVQRTSGAITLRLYDTDIVEWTGDGAITLTADGFRTNTTKSKMNAALRHTGWIVNQRAHQWYVTAIGTSSPGIPFFDGIRLTPLAPRAL